MYAIQVYKCSECGEIVPHCLKLIAEPEDKKIIH